MTTGFTGGNAILGLESVGHAMILALVLDLQLDVRSTQSIVHNARTDALALETGFNQMTVRSHP
jgi:hypothetical protein